MSEPEIPSSRRADFDALGPLRVKHILDGGGWGDRASDALSWLDEQRRADADARAGAERQALKVARSAKNASWVAAAASIAALLATVAFGLLSLR